MVVLWVSLRCVTVLFWAAVLSVRLYVAKWCGHTPNTLVQSPDTAGLQFHRSVCVGSLPPSAGASVVCRTFSINCSLFWELHISIWLCHIVWSFTTCVWNILLQWQWLKWTAIRFYKTNSILDPQASKRVCGVSYSNNIGEEGPSFMRSLSETFSKKVQILGVLEAGGGQVLQKHHLVTGGSQSTMRQCCLCLSPESPRDRDGWAVPGASNHFHIKIDSKKKTAPIIFASSLHSSCNKSPEFLSVHKSLKSLLGSSPTVPLCCPPSSGNSSF